MSGIGHNSEAYGEQIQEPSFVLSEDHKKLFHYVQWHLSDYITGTQGMTPEQEGVYIRFLVRLYDRGQAFQDDDKLMALAMGLDVRRWRRVRADLIQFGKIIIKYGCLTNARFEREKLKRAEELRKQAENTRKYWEERRRKQAAADQLRADFARTSEESPKEVEANFDEKPNEINETSEVGSSPTRDQRLEKKEEENPNGFLSPGDGQDDGRMTASKAAKIAFDLYNDLARRTGIPQCRILNDARKRALALRVKEAGGIDGFKQALANLEKSAYCLGQNENGWVATIDYVCQPKGFAKLFEGGWGNGAHGKAASLSSKYDHLYDGVL